MKMKLLNFFLIHHQQSMKFLIHWQNIISSETEIDGEKKDKNKKLKQINFSKNSFNSFAQKN